MRERSEATQHGRKKLLEHIDTQKVETQLLREKLILMTERYKQFSKFHASALDDNEKLRQVNSLQSDKLKRYMELNSAPTPSHSFIQTAPEVFPPHKERRSPDSPLRGHFTRAGSGSGSGSSAATS